MVRAPKCPIAHFVDSPREPTVHAGVKIETRIHGLSQRLSLADADDFNRSKIIQRARVRFARTLTIKNFFVEILKKNIFWKTTIWPRQRSL